MLCTLIALSLGMEDCVPPPPRPLYQETFAIYRPAPDCINSSRHINYLTKLKTRPVQSGDNLEEYDQAIDVYIARLKHYCQ